jgi:1-acyl-sn-glycerol-3-phosphate acyltransferase
MRWLKCGYFWLALALTTVAALLAALPYFALSLAYCKIEKQDPAKGLRAGIWWYGRIFISLVHPVIPIHCDNPELALGNSPCIIVPNHQSFIDLYLLSVQQCTNLCFVVTSWPFTKLFFFSIAMLRARYIRVGRGEDLFDFMERCKKELAAGSTLVCFPEGTRSRNGQLLPFQSGIFRVAVATGAKLVPLVFYNTGKFCAPGSFKVNPQKIFVKLLPPILCAAQPDGRLAYKNLMLKTRETMVSTLNTPHRSA